MGGLQVIGITSAQSSECVACSNEIATEASAMVKRRKHKEREHCQLVNVESGQLRSRVPQPSLASASLPCTLHTKPCIEKQNIGGEFEKHLGVIQIPRMRTVRRQIEALANPPSTSITQLSSALTSTSAAAAVCSDVATDADEEFA